MEISSLLTTLSVAGVVALTTLAPGVAVAGDDLSLSQAKAAAHASLTDRADLPDQTPRLPDRDTPPPGRRGHATVDPHRRADAAAGEQVRRAAEEAAHAARADVANRSAQGSAASAARSANADERAAAGQARARAARNGNPPGTGNPNNPGQGPKK